MSTLKQHTTAGYGASIYDQTTKLKEAKKSKARAKNQMIFLERCIKHRLLPRSFMMKTPVDGRIANNVL